MFWLRGMITIGEAERRRLARGKTGGEDMHLGVMGERGGQNSTMRNKKEPLPVRDR